MIKRLFSLFFGLFLLLLFLTAAIFPGLFTAYGQKEMFAPWLTPEAEHLLGTNALGYDIFTELVYGAKETLFVGVCSSVLTLFLGAAIGTLSGAKGFVGGVFNGLIHIFALLPKLVTLIVLAAFVGSSSWNLILLIAAFGWVERPERCGRGWCISKSSPLWKTASFRATVPGTLRCGTLSPIFPTCCYPGFCWGSIAAS